MSEKRQSEQPKSILNIERNKEETVPEKLRWLSEMLLYVGNVCYMEMDENFRHIYCNLPTPEIFYLFMALDNGQENLEMRTSIAEEGLGNPDPAYNGKPSVFTNALGMSYMSSVEIADEKIKRIHVIGPVFLDDYSAQKLEKELGKLHLSVSMKHHFMQIIQQFPVIPLNRFYEYGMMLHYCITDEKMRVDEFSFPMTEEDAVGERHIPEDRHGAYLAEQKILKLVEEGNLGYREEIAKVRLTGMTGKMSENHLRQAKDQVLIFTALCARTAIRGGLEPEIAYTLSDQYIAGIEKAENLGKVNRLNQAMLDDFIVRVHRLRIRNDISPQMLSSCDYIGIHLNEKVNIHLLAERLGYSDYYFSSKFKKEVGMSVRDYVIQKRVERACDLLKNGNMDIQDISEELGFSSRSYFGEVFREKMGMSPGEYRNQEKEIK